MITPFVGGIALAVVMRLLARFLAMHLKIIGRGQ